MNNYAFYVECVNGDCFFGKVKASDKKSAEARLKYEYPYSFKVCWILEVSTEPYNPTMVQKDTFKGYKVR